ncbi:MAG: hypothetical protein GWP91_17275 [Rhodobacterales bacterium]|nr:hypothetical protein [Rhodobacterales bacterium]
MRWIELGPSVATGIPQVLVEAIQRHSPVSLLMHGPLGTQAGHFYKLAEDGLVVELPDSDGIDLSPGAVLTVSFLFQHRVAVFMSTIVHQRHEQDRTLVTLSLPHGVMAEMRAHPRIRAGKGSELRALVRVNEGIWEPWVGDVSIGGARLCFDRAAPKWTIGTLLRIDLALHHEKATVVGMIIRREPTAVGIRFQPIADHSAEADDLQRLLAYLEAIQAASPMTMSS